MPSRVHKHISPTIWTSPWKDSSKMEFLKKPNHNQKQKMTYYKMPLKQKLTHQFFRKQMLQSKINKENKYKCQLNNNRKSHWLKGCSEEWRNKIILRRLRMYLLRPLIKNSKKNRRHNLLWKMKQKKTRMNSKTI